MTTLVPDLDVKKLKLAGGGAAGGAAALFVALFTWAQGEHQSVEELVRAQNETLAEQRKQVEESKTQTKLLQQLVTQQAELVKEATVNSRENREAIIRMEARND